MMMRVLGTERSWAERAEKRTWLRGLVLGELVVAAVRAAREKREDLSDILTTAFGNQLLVIQ